MPRLLEMKASLPKEAPILWPKVIPQGIHRSSQDQASGPHKDIQKSQGCFLLEQYSSSVVSLPIKLFQLEQLLICRLFDPALWKKLQPCLGCSSGAEQQVSPWYQLLPGFWSWGVLSLLQTSKTEIKHDPCICFLTKDLATEDMSWQL